MSENAISCRNVGKLYNIGQREPYRTIRDTITNTMSSPFRLLRSLAKGASSRNGDNSGSAFWALKDVSFDVRHGDVVGIIGRNGAGKSTLLKILSRITRPTKGYIDIHGRVGSLLEVGTGFHPELTGRENIFLNGAMLGMKRAEIKRKFDEIVAFAEVEKFIDTPVKRYSSGMYVRLAFGVAAHLEPEVLIVDEVLAVGDAQFQKKCLGKIGDVAKHGRTVLFVSHNMDAVRKLCTRGLLLEQGQLVDDGSTEQVIKKYIEGGAAAQSSFSIPAPQAEENPPGYAYKLVVEDKEGNPATTIPVGQAWQVRVFFRITRPTEHFIIALGFLTNMDSGLRTSWSAPKDLPPGDYQALFREKVIWLAPGRYSLVVGLSTFERPFHYSGAGFLEIAEYADGVDLLRVSNVGWILNPLDIDILNSSSESLMNNR
jgi:lipopolysaccharide transport system ATP-binding protein